MTAALLFAEQLPHRGYQPTYSTGAACPGCGKRAWHVGRRSAECVGCATALPLAPPQPEEGHADG